MRKKNIPLYIKDRKTLLLIPATGLLAFSAFTAFSGSADNFDADIFTLISPYITESRTRVMKFITFYGNHSFLVPANIALILFFIIKRRRWLAITTGAVALSSLGLMTLLKNLTQRNRPPDPLVEGITNFSFPSGHAFMSVAFYGLLMWLTVNYTPDKWKQYLVNSFLLLIILVIGFSRIYLRVHYTSDVIAGYCAGSLWLMLVIALMEKIQLRNTSDIQNDQGL